MRNPYKFDMHWVLESYFILVAANFVWSRSTKLRMLYAAHVKDINSVPIFHSLIKKQ